CMDSEPEGARRRSPIRRGPVRLRDRLGLAQRSGIPDRRRLGQSRPARLSASIRESPGPRLRRRLQPEGRRVNHTRSLSIVIPAYCEAANILGTLDNVTRALAPLAIDAEILVVDDGSTDGTGDLVRTH